MLKMDNSKIDLEIKKTILQEEIEVPERVKLRIYQTLNNLPKKKASSPFIYFLSSAAIVLLTIASISYLVPNESTFQSPGKNGAGDEEQNSNDTKIYGYTYSGESENWKASLKFDGKGTFYKKEDGRTGYNSQAKKSFLMEYKGDYADVAGKMISYSYETTTGGSSGNTEITTDKTITGSSGGKGVAMMQKDEVIEVSVEWDGRKETIVMQPEETNGK